MNRQRSAPSNGTPSLAKSKNGHRIRCGRPSRRSSNQNDRKWSQPSAHSGHSVRLSSTTASLCSRFATTTMSGCQTSLVNSLHNLGVFDMHGLKKTRLAALHSATPTCAVSIEGCQKQLLCFGEFCVFSISQSFRTGDAKNSDTVLFWSAGCSIFMDRRMLAPTSDLCGSDKGKGSPPLAGQPALSRILQGSPPLAGQPSNKGQGSPLSLVGQPALISKLLGSPPLAGSILPFLL